MAGNHGKAGLDELNAREIAEVIELTSSVLPLVLPARWGQHADYANSRHYHSRDGIRVIAEVEIHDHSPWLHVSFSRPKRLPSYDDLLEVKRVFVGRTRKAIQVFPADAEHVNRHKYCLHLWSPLGDDPLPDFRTAGGEL